MKLVCEICGKEYSKYGMGTHKWRVHGDGINFHPVKPGCKVWNTGLTKETDLRVEGYAKAISKTLTGKPWKASSPEIEINRRKKISESMKRNPKAGGPRNGSGVGKGQWYDSPFAGHVWLDSTYEVRVAEYLDKNKISWERNRSKFPYVFLGETKNYYPDFKIKEGYIEVKGYLTKKDTAKWENFPHPLFVIFLEDIINLELGLPPKWLNLSL